MLLLRSPSLCSFFRRGEGEQPSSIRQEGEQEKEEEEEKKEGGKRRRSREGRKEEDGGEIARRRRGGRAKTEYLIYEYVWESLERAREADYGGYYPANGRACRSPCVALT